MIVREHIPGPIIRTSTAGKETSHEDLLEFRSFSSSFILILSAILSAFLIQHLGAQFQKPETAGAWATLGILGLWVVGSLFLRRQLFWILTSYQFAVSILAVGAVSVMVGTFVIQHASPEEYLRIYGRPLSALIQTFFLYDLFHSIWFSTLMLLIGVSLFCVLLKRNPFRLTQLGFLLSHGGIILILAGALAGAFRGETGMIHLNQGMSATSMGVVKNGAYTGDQRDLGFALRLEEFQVDYYPGEYKIYAYRLNPESREYRAIGSYKLKEGSRNRIPGSALSFRIQSATTGDSAEAGLQIDTPQGLQTGVLSSRTDVPVYLNNGEILLALDRREKEAKEYRSFVSVWENGQELKRAVIQVNHPLTHRGLSLYQANYDPDNPTYSGIEVVRDPGLGIVYLGFTMMSLGVVFIFYIRPAIVAAVRRKQEVNHAA